MPSPREAVRQLLTQAVESGDLRFAEAEDLMAAYDAGIYTADEIAEKLRTHDHSAIVLLLVALAALNARPVRWRWDAERQRYVDPKGNEEHPARIRLSVDRFIRSSQDRADAGNRPLTEPRPITTPPNFPPLRPVQPFDLNARLRLWRANLEQGISDRHIAAGAAGKGGFAQLTPADREWIRERILQQYEFLDRFEAEIRSRWAQGRPFGLDYLNARTRLYFESARGTYEEMARRAHREAGFQRERSLLGVAEHCDECIGEFRKGWVPIGTLIPIGQRTCLSNCRCSISYKRIRLAPGAARRRRQAA